MPIPSKAFVLDLDDTLIDTSKVKKSVEERLNRLVSSTISDSKVLTNDRPQSNIVFMLWETYEQVKKQKGFVDYKYLAKMLSEKFDIDERKILNIFYQDSFKDCLIPKAIELVEYLKTLGKVVLFSQGEIEFQTKKINSSGINEIIETENVLIIAQKKEAVNEVIQDLRNEGFTQITFVDDRADILDKAYSLDKNIQCYWVRSGKYKDLLPKTSCVTFQSSSLEEIYQFIYEDNTIIVIASPVRAWQSVEDKIDPHVANAPQDDKKELLKIKIGISPNQVKQLITFTHQDKDIQNFTSDLKRFNNKESFNNWLTQGKYIYSLIDSRDNLLGFIWFNEKNPPDSQYLQNIDQYKITLGIRIYGPARGKGLGKKLFNIALRHFKSTSEYKSINHNGFWSVISSDNLPSKKLHTSLGFTEVTKPDDIGKIVMVFK